MGRTNWSWVVGVLGVSVIVATSARGDTRGASRDSKGSPISFRLASTTPVSDYETMTVENTSVYVGPRTLWSGHEVVTAQLRDGGAIEMTLNSEAARRVAALSREGGDRLAIMVDGKLNSVGLLQVSSGRATVSGLSTLSSELVLRILNGARPVPVPSPALPTMSLAPGGVDGDLYFVDVFIEGVRGMRSYQVGLRVEGGTSGELVREEVSIEEARPDYVFSQLNYLAPADQVGGRAAGILTEGAIDRVEPGYLATYAFRATPDASGTFQVSVETESKSFLANVDNDRMDFQAGEPVAITIGQAPTRTVGDK